MSGVPPCRLCGLQHYSWNACPRFNYPDVDSIVTGGDLEEEYGIRRYASLAALAEVAATAAAKSASMARLERELEHL